jgi:hypothetical protein
MIKATIFWEPSSVYGALHPDSIRERAVFEIVRREGRVLDVTRGVTRGGPRGERLQHGEQTVHRRDQPIGRVSVAMKGVQKMTLQVPTADGFHAPSETLLALQPIPVGRADRRQARRGWSPIVPRFTSHANHGLILRTRTYHDICTPSQATLSRP